MKIKSYFHIVFVILLSFNSISQITKGRIKVRKTNQHIIGKTLSLHDLRTRECGSIFFSSDTSCEITFNYDKEELKNIRVFLNSRAQTKQLNCSYTLITDTSFIIKRDNFEDTCSYVFNNDSSNMVKFFNLPQGVFSKDDYTFFYGFDSIVYSQTYLRSLSDFNFTDSISKIDSIYKNVIDKEKRELLNQQLQTNIKEYKKAINYSFFSGKYALNGKKINLLNTDDSHFATLFLQRKGRFYEIFTHNKFDFSFPLVSFYTHKKYGSVIFNYDKCYLNFYKPTTNTTLQITRNEIYNTDTLNLNFPLGKKPYLFNEEDTFNIINTELFDYLKFDQIIGGYYSTYMQSLNGNKIQLNSLMFGTKEAISTSNHSVQDTLDTWNYKIVNGIFFLYNEKDTLIDEMKNGFESFRFTYHNQQPYVFGAYHHKNKTSGNNDFILLFHNNTGIKFSSKNFDYKYARNCVLTTQLQEKPGIQYEYFIYSATEEFLWLEYQNGNYEEWSFFNFNKAIRLKKGRKSLNYYLVD